MREGVINEEWNGFVDEILGDAEPFFDQTLQVGVYLSIESSNIDDENVLLKWFVQKRIFPITTEGK